MRIKSTIPYVSRTTIIHKIPKYILQLYLCKQKETLNGWTGP